jgi:hypothetical protein
VLHHCTAPRTKQAQPEFVVLQDRQRFVETTKRHPPVAPEHRCVVHRIEVGDKLLEIAAARPDDVTHRARSKQHDRGRHQVGAGVRVQRRAALFLPGRIYRFAGVQTHHVWTGGRSNTRIADLAREIRRRVCEQKPTRACELRQPLASARRGARFGD